jgi:hypothetical protein
MSAMGTWGLVRENPLIEAGAPAVFPALAQATRAKLINHVPTLRGLSIARFVFMIVFVEAADRRAVGDTIPGSRFYSIQFQME